MVISNKCDGFPPQILYTFKKIILKKSLGLLFIPNSFLRNGLVFDPAQITRRVPMGVVVPYDKMSPLEEKISRIIPLTGDRKPSAPTPTPTPVKSVVQPKQPTLVAPKPKEIILHFQGQSFPAIKKGLDGKPYTTSDHYTFTKDSIYSVDEDGITATHTVDGKSHMHYVPFNELEQYELDQVAEWLKEQEKPADSALSMDELYNAIQGLWAKVEKIVNEKTQPSLENKILDLDSRITEVQHKRSKESLSAIQKDYQKALDAIEKELVHPTSEANTAVKIPAKQVYQNVAPALLIPLEKMPWNMDQTVEIKDGHIFVIPHTDHYHNIKMEWFDQGLYEAPAGYTLEQLFATIKYYVQHPEARPKKDGWGDDSDHGHVSSHEGEDLPHGVGPSQPAVSADEEVVDDNGDTEEVSKTADRPDIINVDATETPEAKALYEELWALMAQVDKMGDLDEKSALEAEVDALFTRFNGLREAGTSDTVATISEASQALKAKLAM